MKSVRKDEFSVRDGEHDSGPCVGVKPRPFGERLREERLRMGLTQAELMRAFPTSTPASISGKVTWYDRGMKKDFSA